MIGWLLEIENESLKLKLILGLSSKTPDLLRRTGTNLENDDEIYEHCYTCHSQSSCPVLQLHQRARRAFNPTDSQVCNFDNNYMCENVD